MTVPILILGFDYGTRRIGVASGNTLTQSAQPVKTITRGAGLPWNELAKLIEEFAPAQFVVGLPYNMDGTETGLAPEIRDFARELERRFHRPAALVDERLSSRAAEGALRDARESGRKRSRVTRDEIDRVAATVIVEQWLRTGKTPTT